MTTIPWAYNTNAGHEAWFNREPGIYTGVPFRDYLDREAMNQSTLKAGLASCEHLRHAMDEKSEPTEAMAIGTALHTRVLEPARFHREYALWEKVKGKGPAAMAKEQETTDQILHSTDWEIEAMADTLLRHPQAGPLFRTPGGLAEAVVLWQKDGRLCKCRLDGLYLAAGVVAELKSTTSVVTRDFERSAQDYGYFFQAAWGLEGLAAVTGQDFRWLIAAIEKGTKIVRVDEIASTGLDWGRHQIAEAWGVYLSGLKSGIWTAYPSVGELLPPEWAMRRMEMEMANGE